jgi:hypothetical protein
LIEEDHELKEKLRLLEEENKQLKESRLGTEKHKEKEEKEKSESVESKNGLLLLASTPKHRNYSPVKNLYTSQIVAGERESVPLFSSRIGDPPSALSTISMMSIVEGAISIGLLGECRFLNEISKKYSIN